MSAWLHELDLDPAGEAVRMGTRRLGERPWLVVDEWRDRDLTIKRRLLAEQPGNVLAVGPASEEAGEAVLGLVRADLVRAGVDVAAAEAAVPPGLHPLDVAGRLTQEDLCLLHRTDEGWVLGAASLCFPSRWRLAAKLGRGLAGIHEPVTGYDPILRARVDRLFDRLDDQVVWRRNWFVHPDPALHQPGRPVGGDPVVPRARVDADLWLRSERQTLRAVAPDRVLFTIRIQQEPLGAVRAAVGSAFDDWVREASPSSRRHHGIGDAQATELRHSPAD